ncbi:MAG: DUF222 domain-containing protein [Myxococcales bacterium]|nr:DUF222 domain-containing protein [Myxococcales bacterium]
MGQGRGVDVSSLAGDAAAANKDVAAARAAAIARRKAHAALGARIAEQAYQLDAAMHRLLADLREFDAAGYWADAGATSCASWLAWRVGWDPGTAREHVRVARALGALPRVDAALRAGRLSYSKVRAITRVATPATEAALLDDASRTTAAQLELICRKLHAVQRLGGQSARDVAARRTVSRRERDDGMAVIEAVLPADEAAVVWAAIERAATEREPIGAVADEPKATADAGALAGAGAATDVSAGTPQTCVKAAPVRRVDGLVAMAQAVLRGDAPSRAPIEVVLTISRDALASVGDGGVAAEASAGTIATASRPSDASGSPAIGCFADGTAVSAETARRLACDCGVVAMTTDAAGNPLSVGRRTRSIPAAIARALARRDATCRFPGCTNHRFLAGHHLTHWIHGGETALANLCRLCPTHHRYVHEHGYRVELRDGEPVFFHRGREVHAEPPRPRAIDAPRAWSAIRAANADVAIDATTGQCAWDGLPIDYGLVVDDLARLERGACTAGAG